MKDVIMNFFQLTSQHPYAEMFIGKPHVYTINIKDTNEVTKALQEILNNNTVSVLFIYVMCIQYLLT